LRLLSDLKRGKDIIIVARRERERERESMEYAGS
jgi:hypothetical protein